jgi:hypothetical protein
MQRMRGILHQTSIDVAGQTLPGDDSSRPAGRKRSRDAVERSMTRSLPNDHGRRAFQRASSLSTEQPRLVPSSIADLTASTGMSEYSQRRLVAATPRSDKDFELLLSHPSFQLPGQLVENLKSLGIQEMYPWQKLCLKGPGLLDGSRNLVYCAPTGGGKSLVADCEDPCR